MARHAKQRQGRSKWITVAAILLAVIGVILIALDPIRNALLTKKVESQTITTITAEDVEKNKEAEATFNFEDITPISIESVLKANLDAAKVPSIGGIAVPSVGINLTIAKGVSDLNMLVGAGTLRADQQMGQGNYPLASHYTEAGDRKLLFTPLLKIQDNATIYLTDLKNVYTYKVYWKEFVEATRVDLVENEGDDKIVTLITCEDQNGVGRFVVRGRLESVNPVSEAPDEAKEAFQLAKKTF